MGVVSYEIREADQEAIRYLANNIRQADREEMWYSHGMLPQDAIQICVKDSERMAAVFVEGNTNPAMIFGICKAYAFNNGMRLIWGLQTDLMKPYKRSFMKASREVLEQLPRGLHVFNYVWAGNKQTLRWLAQIGFTIGEARPYGWLGKPFHFVERVI